MRKVSRAKRGMLSQLAATVALAIAVGAIAGSNAKLLAAMLAMGLLALFAALAQTRPRVATVVAIVSLALLPVYLVPHFAFFSPEPTVILLLVLAPVLALYERIAPGLTGIDIAFGAMILGLLMGALAGPAGLSGTINLLFLFVPAYLAGRAVTARHRGPHTFVLGIALAGLASAPFVAYEVLTQNNLFFQLASDASMFTEQWARPDFRTGGLFRSEGAFGHPLSMALVVATAAVCAVALGTRVRGSSRWAWFGLGAALAAVQATSDERSGWVVIVGGLLFFAASSIPPGRRIRHGFAAGLALIPCLIAVWAFLGSSTDTAPQSVEARAKSAEFRRDLYAHAFTPGAIPMFGLRVTNDRNPFAEQVLRGHSSVDSTYLQVGTAFGLVALFPLLAIVGAVICSAFKMRGSWDAVLPSIALANLLALTVVGIQTQLPVFVWLVVGAVSGAARSRASAVSQPDTQLRGRAVPPVREAQQA